MTSRWHIYEKGIKEIRHFVARWTTGAMLWMCRRHWELCGRGGRRIWRINQARRQAEQAVRYSGRACRAMLPYDTNTRCTYRQE